MSKPISPVSSNVSYTLRLQGPGGVKKAIHAMPCHAIWLSSSKLQIQHSWNPLTFHKDAVLRGLWHFSSGRMCQGNKNYSKCVDVHVLIVVRHAALVRQRIRRYNSATTHSVPILSSWTLFCWLECFHGSTSCMAPTKAPTDPACKTWTTMNQLTLRRNSYIPASLKVRS